MIKKSNRISRVCAMALAVMMVFGMLLTSATPVSAANEGTLKIHKLSSTSTSSLTDPSTATQKYYEYASGSGNWYAYLGGATYTIYKIGTFTQTTSGSSVALSYTPLSGLTDTSGMAITTLDSTTDLSTIDLSTATYVDDDVTTTTGEITFNTGLDTNGVYLVKESTLPSGVTAGEDFIITVPQYDKDTNSWTNTIDAFPKNVNTGGKIEKTITSSGVTGNTLYANVGDTVGYQVAVTVPSDYTTDTTVPSGTTYYTEFGITDTASTYLEIPMPASGVIADAITLTSSTGATYYAGTDYLVSYTTGASGNVLTITFTSSTTTPAGDPTLGSETGIYKITPGEVFTITYDAEIQSGAETATSGLVNDAKVTFKTDSGDPYIDPVDPPVVKIYSYGIKKVDESGNALAGATFALATKDASGNFQYLAYNSTTYTWDVVASVSAADTFPTTTNSTVNAIGDEAILHFTNLVLGTKYYLVEISAPTFYVALGEEYAIEIEATTTTTDTVSNTYDASNNYQADTGYTKKITNTKNISVLPGTGGNGIYMFLIIGAILICVAAVLFVKTRKNRKVN
ncbi:MAG: SpaH/EbpB family LPXTG-anchored major pilin [Lachnospiraceae bacterium]